ncbi:MAG: hypothetical protein LBT22_04875, partial [Peptococcaceae bacterium]|nr:hypothetical protein [Peptococcaceae bacterium]
MNTEFEKEKVSADHSVYQPNRFRGGKPLKILLAVVCALMIGVASVAVFSDNNTSTHSIESITEIEKDGYTHKILSAYISNGRIYLDVFFYATDVGMKFSPPSLPDYEVYYQGKKCGGYTKVYGSAIGLSYKMPSVQKGEPMQVSLNAGEDFIADITLLPTNRPA